MTKRAGNPWWNNNQTLEPPSRREAYWYDPNFARPVRGELLPFQLIQHEFGKPFVETVSGS
jgi:hypothetical protein